MDSQVRYHPINFTIESRELIDGLIRIIEQLKLSNNSPLLILVPRELERTVLSGRFPDDEIVIHLDEVSHSSYVVVIDSLQTERKKRSSQGGLYTESSYRSFDQLPVIRRLASSILYLMGTKAFVDSLRSWTDYDPIFDYVINDPSGSQLAIASGGESRLLNLALRLGMIDGNYKITAKGTFYLESPLGPRIASVLYNWVMARNSWYLALRILLLIDQYDIGFFPLPLSEPEETTTDYFWKREESNLRYRKYRGDSSYDTLVNIARDWASLSANREDVDYDTAETDAPLPTAKEDDNLLAWSRRNYFNPEKMKKLDDLYQYIAQFLPKSDFMGERTDSTLGEMTDSTLGESTDSTLGEMTDSEGSRALKAIDIANLKVYIREAYWDRLATKIDKSDLGTLSRERENDTYKLDGLYFRNSTEIPNRIPIIHPESLHIIYSYSVESTDGIKWMAISI